MNNLRSALFLSCLKVTERIERHKVIPLTRIDKIRLKIHLSMCQACKSFEYQSGLIDGILEGLGNEISEKDIFDSKTTLTKKIKDFQ